MIKSEQVGIDMLITTVLVCILIFTDRI